MNYPIVSIYVPTFNHENYIVRALDSIRMQKTQYSFEVFVGEDCSTDNTRQVLKDWEQANPDPRFTIFYREHNMYGQEISNHMDLKLRCNGKYIICLEGDDFWTDPNKLEKQVSFLETHPEYYAVAHNCTVVGEDSLPNGETYPECKDSEYSFRHFASDILPGQLATLLYRNYKFDSSLDKQLLQHKGGPGDRKIYFTLLCHGKIHCIQEAMSAYRHITQGGSSFSATRRYNYDVEQKQGQAFLEYAYKLNIPEAIRCAEMLYLRTIRHAKRRGHIDAARANQDKKALRSTLRATILLLKRDINCRLLHKTLHI